MNKVSPTSSNGAGAAQIEKPKEKILFEIQPLVLPTIINLENLTIIGFTAIIAIASVVFRFGLSEILIIALLYLLIAVPSFQSIFRAGSTTYVLTNQRLVIFSVGFGPKERSIPLDQIQDVKIRQSGLQRFYGAGDINVRQKGIKGSTRLLGLKECRKRADQIRQAVKKAQNG